MCHLSTPVPPANGVTPAPKPTAVGRRRLLMLAAVLPLAAWRLQQPTEAAPLHWQGLALGAPASLVLHHGGDLRNAQAALTATLAEVARLEAMFSLFRADSVISTLNRSGRVDNAPAEFVALLHTALDMAALSNGVFDPSIQPLWALYFDHFVVAGHTRPPAAEQVAQARALVDWRGVQLTGFDVSLARAGMGLSLNGVAQGFITDRCSEVLRSYGFIHTLVDMGEPRAVAAKPDGSAWQIGLADPRQPNQALHTLSVRDQAVATSGGYGTRLDVGGLYTHLINPRTGRTAPAFESVTVLAPTATQADALSTALALMPRGDVVARLALLRTQPGCRAICIDKTGQVSALS
ncbi:MAG: FAD:protein FMN transferase [Rhodoferax sp.]|uniref:FAD:protein FMN transferase n=1 Tax=Rhodoferax sp. TaxID=50421 RepID=UPI002732B897|nr:FAD:protein FMN transferase [Rhodoferax sp.]MDP2681102.1 FAD:protein FMN transferase [Rhodoferax sp.]